MLVSGSGGNHTMVMVASFSLKVLVLLIGVWFGATQAEYVPLQKYVQCVEQLFKLERPTGCLQLRDVIACLEDLIPTPTANQDVCQDEEPYPYCSLLDGSMGAPMVGAESSHPSICSSYMKLKACQDKECTPEGNKFQRRHPMGYPESRNRDQEESCPKKATDECLSPVETVTQVNQETCISVAVAKSCYINKLNDCSGKSEEQRAVDIILSGLIGHVNECLDQGISFTKGDNKCPPNPMDILVPRQIRNNMAHNPFIDESDKEKALADFLKTNCPLVEKIGTDLENYLVECASNATSSNLREVIKTIETLNGPRLQCMKKGYNLPERADCSKDTGEKKDCPKCARAAAGMFQRQVSGLLTLAAILTNFTISQFFKW